MSVQVDPRENAVAPVAPRQKRLRGIRPLIALALVAAFLVWVWLNDDLNQIGALMKSPRGLVVLGLILVGTLVVPIPLKRVITNPWLRFVLITVPIALVTWWTVSPFFIDKSADDAFPALTAGGGPAATTTAAAPTLPMATMPGAPPSTAPPAAAAPAEPVKLGAGELVGIDHRASGTVSVYRLEGGQHVVRFEEFDVQNGPDYRVYLVPAPGQEGTAGGLDLGPLEANRGNLNVAVPPGTDVSGYATVLIWCRAFSVPVANATLAAA